MDCWFFVFKANRKPPPHNRVSAMAPGQVQRQRRGSTTNGVKQAANFAGVSNSASLKHQGDTNDGHIRHYKGFSITRAKIVTRQNPTYTQDNKIKKITEPPQESSLKY